MAPALDLVLNTQDLVPVLGVWNENTLSYTVLSHVVLAAAGVHLVHKGDHSCYSSMLSVATKNISAPNKSPVCGTHARAHTHRRVV